MITTKQINVNLSREKLKLRHVTTKDVDIGVRVEPPKEPIKKKSLAIITTTTLPDVADVAEKKRRDDIAVEKKLAMKDEKKLTINKKGEANKGFAKGDAVYQEKEKGPKLVKPSKELTVELTKKSWNKMNAKERKEYQAEKAKDTAKYARLRR